MKLRDWGMMFGMSAAAALQLLLVRERTAAPSLAAASPSATLAAPAETPAAEQPEEVGAAGVVSSEADAPVEAPPAATSAPAWDGERRMEEALDVLLVSRDELELSPDEVRRLKDVYAYGQHVRTSFEAGIAEVLSIDDTHARIFIPAYPEAGARLEQLLVEEFSAELGEEAFARVDGSLGEVLEVAFKGFGAGAQLLDVDLVDDGEAGLWYHIDAQVEFVDPVDPEAGSDGTPLLTITSSHLLRAETVASGEWRPLARHFPRLPEPVTDER